MKTRAQALRDYIVRRLLLMVPTFLGITMATFLLVQFVPGGQIDQMRMALAGAEMMGSGGGGGNTQLQLDIPDEQLARLNAYYGFDKPLPVAYARWLADTVRLDLGTSFRYNEPVTRVIADRIFENPSHPYTRALLLAVPNIDPRQRREAEPGLEPLRPGSPHVVA
ncbi:MAG: hypothetical protein ACNA8G_09080 [Gammaproteobacteria bacterium]